MTEFTDEPRQPLSFIRSALLISLLTINRVHLLIKYNNE